MTCFKKYLLFSLILALFNAIVLLVFFVPRFNHPDTDQYISTIKYIVGEPGGELIPSRILKPLPILIGAWLTPIIRAEYTLIFQNLIFYFLSVWLVFLFVYRLYKNEKQAFYGTVIYIGAYPMLAYGLASLTDMPGWFFYLFSALIALNFLKKPQLKITLLAGFIAGFGMLFKESVAAAPIFFASLILIATQFPLKEKLKYIFIFGTAFIIFPIINSIFMYKFYSFTYLDWFKLGGIYGEATNGGFYMVSLPRIFIEIGRVLLIGWIFVFFGILKEFTLKNIERIKILFAFIPPSLSFFAWSYPHNRMIYIAAPLLVLLGSFGVLRNYKNPVFGKNLEGSAHSNNLHSTIIKNPRINSIVELILLLLYLLINYTILEFLLRYGTIIQPPGTLFG